MRQIIAFFALALLLAAASGLQATGAEAKIFSPAENPGPASFADLAERLLPAVVNISSTQKMQEPEDYPEMPQLPPGSPFEDFFDEFMDRHGKGMPMVPPSSLGSGFVIDAEKGYIVTNNHVIKDAEDIRVTFHDDTSLPADVIGHDDKTDLALLQVKGGKKITALTFGDSDALRVGDWVIAIGNPFGLGGTVTAGIVSARQRDINSGPYDDYIQTDASINRGNSGGPMFNVNGEVIGINTAIFSPSGGSVGIGFAIPSALAKPVIDQIINFGHTRRGWMGVRIQNVTEEIAESLGLNGVKGALVASVTEGGPAEKAGIKTGDIILKFNGQEINAMRNLPRLVAETSIDSSADITYWRDGKEATTRVAIGELEKAEEEGLLASGASPAGTPGLKIEAIGISLKPITEELRSAYGIPLTVQGVLIDSVENLSEGAIKGLQEGDVIVEIDQQPATQPEKVAEIIETAKKSGRTSVLLLLNHAGDVRFVAVRLGADKKKD